MITKTLTLPELGFIIATRAALGAGLALLLGPRLNMSTRRAVGMALAGVGVVTTIPAAMVLFRDRDRRRLASPIGQDNQLIGSARFARKGDEEY